MNYYQQAVIEALAEDEIQTRMTEFIDHAQEIYDYLRSTIDEKGDSFFEPHAQAGADMLGELIAKMQARLIVTVALEPEGKIDNEPHL